MMWSTCLSALLVSALLLYATSEGGGQELESVPGLSAEVVQITSSMDGTEQPCIVGVPDGYDPDKPTPLLVGLHTWSASYSQRLALHGGEAAKRGWLAVLPNFRGPNLTKNPQAQEAGGSLLAQHDIIDCYHHMLESYNVDADRVYMTGASGGGHMTMLMATKYPDLWAAAAAWVPVTDFRTWHEQNSGYAPHVEAVCGGPPGTSPQVDFEYLRRSPRTFMTNLADTHVLFGHGDRDAAIPIEQSWETFRRLVDLPAHRTVFYVFSGGHEDRCSYGLDWCSQFTRPKEPPTELHLVTDESKPYYWADLEMAEPGSLATCTIKLAGDTLSLCGENLQRVGLDLSGLPLPAEGGFFLSLTNAEELQVDLLGLPRHAELDCEAGWARASATAEHSLVISVAPSAQARTCRVSYQ